MGDVIEVRHVSKVYDLGEVQVNALSDVSVTVKEGSFVAIMGPSGSGKSTFMNILGCLDRPTSGEYLLDGQSVGGLQRDELAAIRSEKIGFVFQNFNLLARTSALENVKLPLLYTSRPVENPDAMAMKALEAVGLGQRMHNQPTQLSGGQQQRVAIARALINQPRLILADEPTGALDSATSQEIMLLFRKVQQSSGITVIIVTHSDEVAAYAERILRFRDGMLVADERPALPAGAPDALELRG
ncbi:ABC transporter ATP-binding protein [Terriglobus roseus]|uniref:Putative ABC transport system ATP-binding protein n=1 Tax=Terriglobus roseus TaxID=392734 RepID=A0A1H4JTG5_9BACT|nr:ABC transporter ATP-binding protein [Terriglobus roseus]SEB49590.1 putative ABC transport system ATP-binding protein [Terriglobus roseus]